MFMPVCIRPQAPPQNEYNHAATRKVVDKVYMYIAACRAYRFVDRPFSAPEAPCTDIIKQATSTIDYDLRHDGSGPLARQVCPVLKALYQARFTKRLRANPNLVIVDIDFSVLFSRYK